ncbi:MAG: hypothetical protein JWQ44_2913 [Chthoniobacter sp.]|nr:hypothetical protein [Chthoniobacter sp.]
MAVKHTYQSPTANDPTKEISSTRWNEAHTIDAGTVTLAMQADMATASVVYRKTTGSGAPEVQTLATLKADLGLTGSNSGDETAAGVLAKLLTVDGAGSGLDADLLDGLSSAAFATAAQGALAASASQPGHTHAQTDVTGLVTALSGKQPLATVLTNTTASYTTAEQTKLAGVATGATANSADATLLARANHTGTQAATTVLPSGGGTLQDYVGFSTRAAFVTWASGKTPSVGTRLSAGGYAYRYTGSGTAISDLAGWVPFGTPTVMHFGAAADNVTDDAVAFNALAAYLTASASALGSIPAGSYRLASSVTLTTGGSVSVNWALYGEGKRVTKIYVDFAGAGLGVFNLDATTSTGPAFGNFSVHAHSNRASTDILPTVIKAAKIGNAFITKIHMPSVYYRGKLLQCGALANVRFEGIESFNAGYSFAYKDTGAALFSNVGAALTSDTAIFSAGDVGKVFNFSPSGYVSGSGATGSSTYAQAVISAYIDSTHVTLATVPSVDVTGCAGMFEAARVSGSSGGTNLQANAACFRTDHVGAQIWVSSPSSTDRMQVVTITAFVDASNVTISPALTATVTAQEFCAPVMDIGDGTAGNDVQFDDVHIELFAGVALGLNNHTLMRFVRSKIHGNFPADASRITSALGWIFNGGGAWDGGSIADSVVRGEAAWRFFNQRAQNFVFADYYGTYNENVPVWKLGVIGGGTAPYTFGGVVVNGANLRTYFAPVLANLFSDANATQRFQFTGFLLNQTALATSVSQAAFGWGNTGSGTNIGDWDTTTTASGVYNFSVATTGTRPTMYASSDFGTVEVRRYSSVHFVQTAIRQGAAITPLMVWRTYSNGTWSTWRQVVDDVTGAAFTSTLKGLVPASGGGTTNFLRADGTFAAPPSSGTTSSGKAYARQQGLGAI